MRAGEKRRIPIVAVANGKHHPTATLDGVGHWLACAEYTVPGMARLEVVAPGYTAVARVIELQPETALASLVGKVAVKA